MAEVNRNDAVCENVDFTPLLKSKLILMTHSLLFSVCVSVSGESSMKTAQKSIVCWPLSATIQRSVMVSLQCLRWNSQGINSALKLTATMANIYSKLLPFWLLLKPKCEYAKAHSVLCYMDFLSPSWRLSRLIQQNCLFIRIRKLQTRPLLN